MTHLAKAKHHHGKIGKLMDAGDTKTALHHVGHLLLALRQHAKATVPAAENASVGLVPQPSTAPKVATGRGLRDRLTALVASRTEA